MGVTLVMRHKPSSRGEPAAWTCRWTSGRAGSPAPWRASTGTWCRTRRRRWARRSAGTPRQHRQQPPRRCSRYSPGCRWPTWRRRRRASSTRGSPEEKNTDLSGASWYSQGCFVQIDDVTPRAEIRYENLSKLGHRQNKCDTLAKHASSNPSLKFQSPQINLLKEKDVRVTYWLIYWARGMVLAV